MPEDMYTRAKCCVGNQTRQSKGDPSCWMDGYSYEDGVGMDWNQWCCFWTLSVVTFSVVLWSSLFEEIRNGFEVVWMDLDKGGRKWCLDWSLVVTSLPRIAVRRRQRRDVGMSTLGSWAADSGDGLAKPKKDRIVFFQGNLGPPGVSRSSPVFGPLATSRNMKTWSEIRSPREKETARDRESGWLVDWWVDMLVGW